MPPSGVPRKKEHIEIATTQDIASPLPSGWEDIRLVHQCLPEVNKHDIDLSVRFLGKHLSHPFVISALTGGHSASTTINRNLARAAQEFGIGMEVGSQRPLLQMPDLRDTYSIVRDVARDAFIVGNIGAPQLIAQGQSRAVSPQDLQLLVETIHADALAIHLNFLQEAVAIEGDTSAAGCLNAIKEVTGLLSCCVVAKETGAGMSREQAMRLKSAGVAALDVGGAGGSNMALLESHSAALHGSPEHERLGRTFAEWGIPTPVSVVETVETQLPVIASGGIRNGLDAAKALALGATLVGIGRPLLLRALESFESVADWLRAFFAELTVAMFLAGAATVGELRRKPVLIFGKTGEWLRLRGHDSIQFARQGL